MGALVKIYTTSKSLGNLEKEGQNFLNALSTFEI